MRRPNRKCWSGFGKKLCHQVPIQRFGERDRSVHCVETDLVRHQLGDGGVFLTSRGKFWPEQCNRFLIGQQSTFDTHSDCNRDHSLSRAQYKLQGVMSVWLGGFDVEIATHQVDNTSAPMKETNRGTNILS